MNTQQIKYVLRNDAKIAADRNADLIMIQEEVDDLSSVYADTSVLVNDQGQMIDHIDDDVTKAVENTDHGVKSLDEARIKVEKRRKNMLFYTAVAFVVVALAVAGGYLLRGAFGLAGPVGMLAGAAVMIAAVAVIGGIGYGIYSLVKWLKPKPAQEADHVDAPKSDLKESQKIQPAKTNSKGAKPDLSAESFFNLVESPSVTDSGIEGVKGQIATQVFKRMM